MECSLYIEPIFCLAIPLSVALGRTHCLALVNDVAMNTDVQTKTLLSFWNVNRIDGSLATLCLLFPLKPYRSVFLQQC